MLMFNENNFNIVCKIIMPIKYDKFKVFLILYNINIMYIFKIFNIF